MGNIKENVQKVFDECNKCKAIDGAEGVINHIVFEQTLKNPLYDDIKYRHCPTCKTGNPNLFDNCLVCGNSTIVDDKEPVEDKLKIKITGEGTKEELHKALSLITELILTTSIDNINISQWKDCTLMTEILK